MDTKCLLGTIYLRWGNASPVFLFRLVTQPLICQVLESCRLHSPGKWRMERCRELEVVAKVATFSDAVCTNPFPLTNNKQIGENYVYYNSCYSHAIRLWSGPKVTRTSKWNPNATACQPILNISMTHVTVTNVSNRPTPTFSDMNFWIWNEPVENMCPWTISARAGLVLFGARCIHDELHDVVPCSGLAHFRGSYVFCRTFLYNTSVWYHVLFSENTGCTHCWPTSGSQVSMYKLY